MTKLKVAFDIEEIWENFGVYRDTLKELTTDETVQLYLITKSTDTDMIASVQTAIGITPSYTFQVADNDGIIDTIEQYDIDIYLEGDPIIVDLVNKDTTARCILVNSIPDRFKMQPKWVTDLQFWSERLLIELNTDNASQSC